MQDKISEKTDEASSSNDFEPNEFKDVSSKLTNACDDIGLIVPKFSSQPSLPGALRTIKRMPTGAQVAVATENRLTSSIVTDMIDGICVLNNIYDSDASSISEDVQEIHDHLWQSVTAD